MYIIGKVTSWDKKRLIIEVDPELEIYGNPVKYYPVFIKKGIKYAYIYCGSLYSAESIWNQHHGRTLEFEIKISYYLYKNKKA